MAALLSKYLVVIGSSMLKFILGPITGFPLGMTYLETYACTVAGMMATVLLLTYLGLPIRQWVAKHWASRSQRKTFTPRNRRIVRIWTRYGMKGVAFLTPLLFSPPLGTLIAVSFGERPDRIVGYMLASAIFWGALLTGMVRLLGTQVVETYLPGL
jgi:uncharacterized membrane protein